MLLALTANRWQPALMACNRPALIAFESVLLLLLAASFFVCDPSHFPFPWAVLPVAATAGLLISTGSGRHTPVSTLLSLRWLLVIGLISYSLYLWHWPIFVLMRWTSGLESLPELIAALALTFLMAAASYVFVERPIRTSPRMAALPRFAVVVLFCVVAVAASRLSIELFGLQRHLSLSVTSNSDIWGNKAANRGCLTFRDTQEITADAPIACRRSNDRLLMVVGDSHAGAYERLLGQFSQDNNIPILLYSTPGCAFLNFRDSVLALTPACAAFDAAAKKDLLRRASLSTVVFLPSLRIDRLRDQWGGPNSPVNAVSAVAIDEALQFFQALSAKGATVVLEAPTPVFMSPPFRCSDWFNRNNPVCLGGFVTARSLVEARRAEIVAAEKYLAGSVKRVFIWDPAQTLCDSLNCNAFADGKPLFHDGDHLSGYGNDVLYPDFRKKLLELARESGGDG
jgi:hypothetical protein